MRAIPLAVRENILALYSQGKKTREIAEAVGFCVAAVRRVRQQFKQRGTLKPQTHRCGRKSLLTAGRKVRLQQLVIKMPGATLAELGARMDRPYPTSTIDAWLRRLGLSYTVRRPPAVSFAPGLLAVRAPAKVPVRAAARAEKEHLGQDYVPESPRRDWCMWLKKEAASE